jgi:hypothetical protein
MPNIVIQNTGNADITIGDVVVTPTTSRGFAIGDYDITLDDTATIVNNGLEYVPEQFDPWQPEQLPSESIKVTDAQGLVRTIKPNTARSFSSGVYRIEVVA